MVKLSKYIPGLLLSNIVAILSINIFKTDYLGAIPIAIIIGFLLNFIFNFKETIFIKGINFSEKKILDIAIVLLGSQFIFNFDEILKLIPFVVLLIIISISTCYFLGRFFNISKSLSLLIGIGNGICGSAAIAASSKMMGSKEDETGISITIVNFLGVLLLFLLPVFDNPDIGYIIGGTIQAMGQVVGSVEFLSDNNVKMEAIQTKMLRILMLGPSVILLSFLFKKNNNTKNKKYSFSIPFFIIGFAVIAFIRNAEITSISINAWDKLGGLSKYLLTVAMTGVGLKISFENVLNFGFKPVVVAMFGSIIQIISAVILISII